MITYITNNFNTINQHSYNNSINDFLNSSSFRQLSCSNCHQVGFHIHGYYQRYVITHHKKIKLHITRVICPHCRKTHAVLPDWLLPYRQITLKDMVDIITCDLLDVDYFDSDTFNPMMEPTHIRYIIHQFHLSPWAEFNLLLLSLPQLISLSFSLLHKHFMQMRGSCFLLPT